MDYSLFPTIPVQLERSSLDQNWGFRLQGGFDFRVPLSIKKVLSLIFFSKNEEIIF
jgi:hypothetical protein